LVDRPSWNRVFLISEGFEYLVSLNWAAEENEGSRTSWLCSFVFALPQSEAYNVVKPYQNGNPSRWLGLRRDFDTAVKS
jgi:hypothetical protein